MDDAVRRDRVAKGFDLPHTKLTDDQVRDIRRRYDPTAHQGLRGHRRSNARELAEEFGLHPVYVQQIAYGKYRKGC